MTKEILDCMTKALEKAEVEHDKASYLSESGSNPGLRQMNFNKAEWLRWVTYLAKHGLEALKEEERLAAETELVEEEDEDGGWATYKCENCIATTELKKLVNAKDTIIEDLTNRLKALQLSYDCEIEYRKALAAQAKIDHFTEVLRIAHDRCWLDGTVLVTPVEYLDRALLELIKE